MVKAGYTKNTDAQKYNKIIAIAVILAIVALWLLFSNSGQKKGAKIENVLTREYTKTYTVERFNEKVDKVYVDWNVYDIDTITGYNPDDNSESIDSCDEIDNNDEGQVCVLTDTIRMWRFLDAVGY